MAGGVMDAMSETPSCRCSRTEANASNGPAGVRVCFDNCLRDVVAAAPLILFVLDRHGTFTLCEGKALALLGLTSRDLVGRSAFEVGTPEIVEANRRALSGEAFTAVLEMNGVVFESRYTPLRDAEGGVTGVVGVAIDVTERVRVEQALNDDSEGSASLARVGQEILALLDTPILLNRLCQLTTEVLACDCSHIWLWRPEDGVYVPVAGYGDDAEEWESIRLLRIPRAPFTNWFARLERGDVIPEFSQLSTEHPFARWAWRYGVTVRMYLPLRRGPQMIGFQIAGYRGRSTPFTLKQQRIGIAIAQLASMALENARLVEELGRANRFKTDIVATIAHELRTPLNAIMGYTDLLLEGEFGPLTDEQAEISRRVDRSAQVLRDLVNGTLELSRLDTGRLPLNLRDVDLLDLISEIDAETRELRAKPSVEFRWKVPASLPRLYSDPLKIKVVLKNLIANAIKFTSKGEITVTVATAQSGIEISVADTGIGIRPEMLAVIFEPFRQGECPSTRHYEGVGLGLYLVRRMLELLGGTVDVESEVGRGSVFRVWLPLHSAPRCIEPGGGRVSPSPLVSGLGADARRVELQV